MRNPLSDHSLDRLRPNGKSRQLRVRLEPVEDQAFTTAARLSGLSLSAWVRMNLREAAERRLTNAGRQIPWSK